MVAKVIALLIASGYLFVAAVLVDRDGPGMVTCVLAAVLPLPFIWFPEALGNYSGPASLGYVARPTPGVMIAVAGWIMLILLPPFLIAIFSRQT